MGRKRKIKHINYKTKEITSEYKINRDDLRYLLPVLKEIIKTVHPPSSMLIETAYFIYKNAGELIGIYECLKNGDHDGAIKYALKIFGKEAGESVLNYIYNYYSEEYVNSISDSVGSSLEGNANKETAKKLTQGTINGFAEAVNEKIIDKIAEKIEENNEKEEKLK